MALAGSHHRQLNPPLCPTLQPLADQPDSSFGCTRAKPFCQQKQIFKRKAFLRRRPQKDKPDEGWPEPAALRHRQNQHHANDRAIS